MGQKQASVLLRLTAVLVLVLSMTAMGRSVRAQDAGNGGTAGAYADGGTVTSTTVINISADGGTAVADASGGSDNDVLVVAAGGASTIGAGDGTGVDVSVGNGGDAVADASGGTVIVGDTVSGGNSGNDILIGDTVAGHGSEAVVIVDGGTSSFTTEINASADGGTAVATAAGGSGNVVTVAAAAIYAATISGGTVSVGNGGIAAADASGGMIAVGDVISGGNVGSIITVGDTIGGDSHCGECAPVDPAVIIDGGNVVATTVLNLSADGGSAVATANGGTNVVNVLALGVYDAGIYDANVSVGNGGDAAAFAAGGDVTVGDVLSGGNTGNIITVEDTLGGDGPHGGEALVDIVGGDVVSYTEVSISADGGDAEAWADGGNDNVVNLVAVGGYATIGDDDGDDTDGANVSVGNGGIATAAADGGSVTIGDIVSGGNVGNDILVGDTVGGDGSCGCEGGDASVFIDGGLVVSATYLDISADGGSAYASASGGDGNVVNVVAANLAGGAVDVDGDGDIDVDDVLAAAPAAYGAGIYGADVAVGNGGEAGAYANGGDITVGTVYSGENFGHLITVGDTVGGTNDGDATVEVFGGDVVSITEGAITADGGVADAFADGGDDNVVNLFATGVYGAAVEGADIMVGEGGTSFTDASGGTISLGDIVSGGNTGNTITIGDTCGGGAVDCPTDVDECEDDCGECDSDCGECDSDCGECDEDCGECDSDCNGGSHSGGSSSGGSSSGGAKAAVSALPNTGAGAVQGEAGMTGLFLVTTVLALAGAAFGLRQRIA